MYFKQSIGKLGEDIACLYLEKNNYKIIKRNFRCKQGELDIIAFNLKKELIFIEVKTRNNINYGFACEAVNKYKKRHIYNCAKYYLFLNNLLITPDVVEHISAPKDSILEMIIIQSKKTTSFGEDAVMKWKTISGNLLDLSKTTTDFTARYNADILEAFTTFRDTYTRLITSRVKLKFRFYYATLASELHPNVIQQAEELKDTIKGLFPNAVVEVTFVDSDTLFEMYNAVIENRVNLKFADIPISPNQKNYVALVDLKSYFNFIVNDEGDVRKSFFDSNVRDYQGKNNVNSSISETLHRADDNDFW